MLAIKHKVSGKEFKVDVIWLRDHCRCDQCYNVETKQRKNNFLDIPETVKPVETKYINNGLQYEVQWSDGHKSIYDVNFLFEAQVEQLRVRTMQSGSRTPWNCATVKQHEQDLRVSLPKLILSQEQVKKLVASLIRYGIAFIDDVPPTTAMTELAVRSVFPIMKTFFGEMFTFTDAKDHADTAYSKLFLGSHTDNTYFCDAAGVQTLHCISHINGKGGESFFVDGLHAALELKRRNPHAFDVLTKVHVPAEYIEKGQHHKYSAPIIRVDPVTSEIIQLRLNVYDRALFNTIPQDQMQDFYQSFREFLKIVQDPENQWTFKLQPGTVVLFDNWRAFHGRLGYTGLRTMTGCYVQRTDFLSKARLLGLIE